MPESGAEEFQLFPGAFIKGDHIALNLKSILDVYNPQEYKTVDGERLPEQRPKSNALDTYTGNAPQYIPGKVLEQTKSILSRGDKPDELKAYLEQAKAKMPVKFKNAAQNILILAARQSRVKCACLLIDEYGADVNGTSNVKKHSSLHFAAYNGDKVLAKELLQRGASKLLTNVYGETPDQTANTQMENAGGDEEKRTRYEECRDLINDFTLSASDSKERQQPASGLENISIYVPTSQKEASVDPYEALNRSSISILNKVTDDIQNKMLKRLKDLVPVSGFNRPERKEKFEIRHFKLLVENLWKTAIAQPATAGLYADLASKLHEHFTAHSKDIVHALPTNSGKFYRMVFDEKLVQPLFESERNALAEAAKCVNFKRELLIQCQKQFDSERDLARFRRAVDWASLTEELDILRAQNDVMYERNKAQDRMTANVVFIGQLYNHGLATTSIVRMCVEDLLPTSRIAPEDIRNSKDPDALKDYIAGKENDLTMLVRLIEVIGQKFEKAVGPAPASGASQVAVTAYEKAKRDSDRRRKLLAKWFKAMKKITDPTKTGAEGEFRLQNRVRFAVQDLMELRSRGWVTRGLAEAKGKTKSTTDDDGWTSVRGGGGSASGGNTDSSSASKAQASIAQSKKASKAARKAEKARLAAEAKAKEEAARRTECNKEAQRIADDLHAVDQESERIRVQIAKHMNGPKQARQRKKMNMRLKKLKTERNSLKQNLKVARAKGPDAATVAEAKEAAAAASEKASSPGGGGGGGAGGVDLSDLPAEDEFFELPPLKSEAKVKGMTNEFLKVTQDFAEWSLSLKEMELKTDEDVAAVVFYLLVFAVESLSSASKKKDLDLIIALLKHLLENGDVSAAQFALSVKALNCIIDDIKMDAPLAGKVYDEVMAAMPKSE